MYVYTYMYVGSLGDIPGHANNQRGKYLGVGISMAILDITPYLL